MSPRQLMIAVCAATATAIALAVLPFAYYMQGLPVAIKSSGPWGEFGSYLGGVLGPAIATINLLVVLYIAVRLTDLQQNQLERKRLTLDLYNEWHSEKLRTGRIAIEGLVAQLTPVDTGIPSLSEFEKTDPARSHHARDIFYFFEKWALLRQAGELDDRILNAALGGRVEWWNLQFLHRLRRAETDEHVVATLDLVNSQVLELSAQAREPR